LADSMKEIKQEKKESKAPQPQKGVAPAAAVGNDPLSNLGAEARRLRDQIVELSNLLFNYGGGKKFVYLVKGPEIDSKYPEKKDDKKEDKKEENHILI